jgi:hypothetical protein
MLNHKNMRSINPVNSRTVLGFNAREVQRFTPPGIHMRLAQPPLKQGKVGSIKRPE